MRTKLFIISLLFVGVVAAPAISRANTNDVLLQQIASLLAQVQFLQSQLNAIEGGTPGPVVGTPGTPTVTTTPNVTCPSITADLSRGSRGSEVESLQRYLTQTGHYTYGEVTGYYGSATEAAVQRFQASQGVVSSGTAASTGYGVVGPKTRKALNASCTGATYNEAIARDLVITPEVGQLPLQVTATFSLNSSSCSSYILDWGDGTKPLSFDAGLEQNCTKDIAHKRATHTYNVPGTHQVVLRAGHGPLSQARVVSRTFVSVGDTAPSGFSISPTTGSAPLTTSISFPVLGSSCTSYEADWGDGTIDRHQAASYDFCTQDSGTQSITHTYTDPGTYTVRFKTGRAPIAQLEVNEQWNVIVQNDVAAGAVVEIKPTAGNAPLIVKVDMYGFSESCTSYSLDWGDNSTVQQYEATQTDCGGGQFQKTFTHTYIAPGNYVIRAKIGESTSLASLPLNTQTIVVGEEGSGVIRANCPYPDTPVCGEIVYSCPIGYTCDQAYRTYQNRCAMEDDGAVFVHSGQCNF